jgi:hypothetical protein
VPTPTRASTTAPSKIRTKIIPRREPFRTPPGIAGVSGDTFDGPQRLAEGVCPIGRELAEVAVSPSLAVPLLRAAANESQEILQEMWAALLAAAMDPEKLDRVRLSFIETVKRLDPPDTLILKKFYATSGTLSPNVRDHLVQILVSLPGKLKFLL